MRPRDEIEASLRRAMDDDPDEHGHRMLAVIVEVLLDLRQQMAVLVRVTRERAFLDE